MKKPIIISVLFFIISSISSFGQGVWIEENVDPETGLRTGKIETDFGTFEIKPNADLSRGNLYRFDLRNANLEGANLSFAGLDEADIQGANLEGADLGAARVGGIRSGKLKGTPSALPFGYKIINGYLVGRGVSLNGADLQGADLQGMDLSYVYFNTTNLEGANLSGTKLDKVYWSDVKVTPNTLPEGYSIIKGNLVGPNTNLKRADLEGANLDGLNLDGADLEEANLKNASLINTSLKNANLLEADFSGANLEGASLRESSLHKGSEFWSIRTATLGTQEPNEEAIFSGANLRGVDFGGTSFIINGRNISAFVSANILENYKSIKALQANIVEGENGGGISPEQAAAITANTTKIDELDGILTTADETLEAFSENIDTLNENDQILNANDESITEQMATLSENDQSIMAEINAMKAQLQTLVAQVAEKDQRIAELEQGGEGQSLEQVLEQVRDARAGSVVLTVDPDGDNITLGLTIEQSDNLIEWTKLDGEMTRTIPIPDGKKFYRFALDK
ncbi:pentapeptide repeat-containing protein [Verrucomicrobiales bacterium]|nr:pentapeptide repeat-containing protein [Verrucomicrobiales bacterium]